MWQWRADSGSLLDRCLLLFFFFFSSRRRHTRLQGDWSSDVCSSDLCNLFLLITIWIAYIWKRSSRVSLPSLFFTPSDCREGATLASLFHSLSEEQNASPIFSTICALFAQNCRGGTLAGATSPRPPLALCYSSLSIFRK